METKELKIQIPEGYEIDKANSTFEKIVFKSKEDIKASVPKSWEEYCKQQKANKKIGYYIVGTSCTPGIVTWNNCFSPDVWRNVLPSRELENSFLAMMQLMSLRESWIGDWEPDWKDSTKVKWNIIYSQNLFCLSPIYMVSRALSFPTKEMAEDFMNCFKDLLEIAKPLI